MTISSSVAKSGPYNGNGATASFSYGFKIIAESHIAVILTDADAVETVQTITTDYTVTGVGDANGGSVVMVTAPATGELLTLKLNVPLTQEVDLENQGAFFAETIEASFDKVTQIVVQQQEVIDRCVQVDISSGDDPADFLDSIDAAVAAAAASASSASASASTATTQASNASTSAANAATAETNAETAEVNAEAAQTAAEAAQAAAEAAAAAAEVAKIEWQGAWSGATAYALNDAVSYGGSSWICVQAHTNQTPADTAYWDPLAVKGTDGSGGTVTSIIAGTGLTGGTITSSGTVALNLGNANTWTASQRATITTDNDGSFDESVTNNFFCTPTGSATLTFTNHTAGQSGFILLVNGSNYAITAAATTKINSADLTTISATGTYLLSYLDNGTNAYVVVSKELTS